MLSMTDTQVHRFGRKAEPFRFGIEPGDEVFVAVAKIPADNMATILERFTELRSSVAGNGTNRVSANLETASVLFEEVLTDESLEVFRQRMGDKSNPIGLEDIIEIMQYLLGEVYGLRPTRPSSPSGDTSESDGESSTDGAPPEESTPQTSTGDDSSTSSTTGPSTG